MESTGKLVFFCGKMGAGKTTQSKLIAAKQRAVLISEDEWLAAHYPNQIQSFEDYIKFSTLIKPFIKSHVQSLLTVGVDVVMDFPANTVRQRSWFSSLCSEVQCAHELCYLDVSDEVCLVQIGKRRVEQPERAHFDTEDVFHHVTQYFEEPTDDEGLNIVKV
ncbi:Thymidylate kinase [Vibrio mediterranei]|uniref:ATP-binding protein n=1 Tax=Vibrio mediterranei TaxID=689 RepID=A0A3G4VKE5_9VIBR|nr:ATP-binding protein [Vibrio mediterranei]AYV24478.1 ATP-binding protein [Vibrio mediterranei]SBO08331.1 Thymidylate kinase [Vibrio mediterranei]